MDIRQENIKNLNYEQATILKAWTRKHYRELGLSCILPEEESSLLRTLKFLNKHIARLTLGKGGRRILWEPRPEDDRFRLEDVNVNAKLLLIDQSTRDIGDAIQAHQMELGPNGQTTFDKYFDLVGEGLIFDHVPSTAHNLTRWDMLAEGADFPIPVKEEKGHLVVDRSKCIKQTIYRSNGESLPKPIQKCIVPLKTIGGNLKPEERYSDDGDELAIALAQRLSRHVDEEELEKVISQFKDNPRVCLEKYKKILKQEEIFNELNQEVECPAGTEALTDLLFADAPEEEDKDLLVTLNTTEAMGSTPRDVWFVAGDIHTKFYDFMPEDHPLIGCIKEAINYLSGPKDFFDLEIYLRILGRGLSYRKPNKGKVKDGIMGFDYLKYTQFPVLEEQLTFLGQLAQQDELTIRDVENSLTFIETEWWNLNCDEYKVRGKTGEKIIRRHRAVSKVLNEFPQVMAIVEAMDLIRGFHYSREADASKRIFEVEVNGNKVLVDAISKLGQDIYQTFTIDVLKNQVLRNLENDSTYLVAGDENWSMDTRAMLHAIQIYRLVMGRWSSVNGKRLELVVPGFYGDLRKEIPPVVNVSIIENGEVKVIDINRCTLAELGKLPFIQKVAADQVYWGRPWKEAGLRASKYMTSWLTRNPKLIYPLVEKILGGNQNELKRLRVELMKNSVIPKDDLKAVWDIFNACVEVI